MPYYNKRLCKATEGQSRQIQVVRALLCLSAFVYARAPSRLPLPSGSRLQHTQVNILIKAEYFFGNMWVSTTQMPSF